jgi:hypothetical protein
VLFEMQVAIHLSDLSIHIFDVSIHLVYVAIHLFKVSIHLFKVSIVCAICVAGLRARMLTHKEQALHKGEDDVARLMASLRSAESTVALLRDVLGKCSGGEVTGFKLKGLSHWAEVLEHQEEKEEDEEDEAQEGLKGAFILAHTSWRISGPAFVRNWI